MCLNKGWFSETREGLQARVSVSHRGGSTGSRAFTLAWRSAGCYCKNRFLTLLSSIVSRYFEELQLSKITRFDVCNIYRPAADAKGQLN
jgi:hypothetical protein